MLISVRFSKSDNPNPEEEPTNFSAEGVEGRAKLLGRHFLHFAELRQYIANPRRVAN